MSKENEHLGKHKNGNNFIVHINNSNGFTRHSNCCNEEVTVVGEVTKYYQCNYCKQPCDIEMMEDERG
jgi:hypothetical protein